MPETPNPMEPIRRLGERLQEIAAEIGLDLKTFVPVVDFEHDGHMIQAVFILNEEALQPEPQVDPEQAKFDAQFAQIEQELFAQLEQEREEEKIQSVTDRMLEMRKRLAEGKPLLDD